MIHSFPYSLRFENEWIIYSNSVYRVTQKSFNIKHSLVLTGIFKFMPVTPVCTTISQLCELCIEHGGSNFENVCKYSK
jgi:hypothetical protein